MDIEIICPKCEHIFKLDEYIKNDVKKEVSDDLNKDFQNKIAAEKAALNQKYLDHVIIKNKEIEEQKNIEIQKAKEDAEKAINDKMSLLQSTNMTLIDKINSEKAETEKARRELNSQKLKLEAEFQAKVSAEILKNQSLVEQTISTKDMQISELSKQMLEIKKANAELELKILKGSQQAQGEVQEKVLEDMLKANFRDDIIHPVPTGIKGADVTQEVRTPSGKTAGIIVYESKRTKAFCMEWIKKLQDDAMKIKADILVIATLTMPKDSDKIIVINGVYVVRFDFVNMFTTMIREALLMVFQAKESNNGKDEKMNSLYNYLTSIEFKNTFEQVIQTYGLMQSDLEKEKKQMEKHWAEREKTLLKVITNTQIFYDSIKSIAGDRILIETQEAKVIPEAIEDIFN
jgi:hypothetical protein